MIKWLYSLIPWEKNLRSDRKAIAFSLKLQKRYSVELSFRVALRELLVDLNFDQFRIGEDKAEIQRLIQQGDLTDEASLYFDLLTGGPRINKSTSVRYFGWISERNRQSDGIKLICSQMELTFQAFDRFIHQLDGDKFHLGFFYDADYLLWQSKYHLKRYKYSKGLKTIGAGPTEKVDISGRPGRVVQIPGYRAVFYSGAAHFWFGKLAFTHLPRTRILSFPHAERIEELPNGIIHLHLYDGIFDGDKPENQRRQYLLREHLGLE